MKRELTDWLGRRAPIHLSVLFPTDDARRDCRFVLAAIQNLLILDPSPDKLSTLWPSARDLQVLIARLVRKRELLVGEDLQQVLDRGLYNTALEATFSGLWDARFEYTETQDASQAIERLVAGCYPMTDSTAWVRHDMALFWLTLAAQNDLLDQAVAWVPLDVSGSVERWDQIYQLLLSAERWAPLGSTLRFLIGLVEGTRALESLEGHPLSAKLRESLVNSAHVVL